MSSPSEAAALDAHSGAAPASKKPRGEGSSHAVTFRDPPGLQAEAHALQLEIARTLVRAPSLPVDLPAFRMRLLGVGADKRGIDLVLGMDSPIARLRITGASPATNGSLDDDAPKLVNIGKAPSSRGAVTVSIEAIHADSRRFDPELRRMAERISAAVTQAQWEAASATGKRLMRLPVDVPLGFFRQMVAGLERPQGLVRTGFNCNQDCGLCWQGRDWGRFGPDQIVAWIEDLATAGARYLIISGGEPTLDPELYRYLRRARELGFLGVTLETNAIQMAKAGVSERLREAGLTDCFVSLHSGDAEVSDAITRAPGTFVRTVKGIQNLLAAGVTVSLNCVMTNEGLDHLDGLPDFIDRSFGRHPLLQGLMLSSPTDSFERALIPSLLPDPKKLRAVLRPTIDRAFALGITVRGLDGPCGPPLCAFGADRRITDLKPVPEAIDFRHQLPACADCTVRGACFGVRDAQVAIYGDDCVEPIRALPA